MPPRPKIGIVGKGNVGSALETGLRRAGYEVRSAGKDPPKVAELAKWGELIVLAVPFSERENALKELGTIKGKTLVDVTNALTSSSEFATDLKQSGAEELQKKAKGAKVVKAFNTVFAENMSRGKVKGEQLTLFVAGDAKDAKEEVVRLGTDLGFDSVDAGPLKNARWLETLGYLNIQLGYEQKLGTESGIRLVH